MDAMLQNRCAKYIYVVPDGLRELMTDISREVLRSQPENMYTFIADYLDALLITRENARVAARLVQNITEITTTTVEFLKNTGMSRIEANNIVSIIQTAFQNTLRQEASAMPMSADIEETNIISHILDEADLSPDKGEEAARIIQHAFRVFKLRKEKEKELLSGMIDWRVAARSAIQLYRKTGVTNEEANRAATLIKAAYKGYYTRRIMKRIVDEGRMLQVAEDEQEQVEEEASLQDLRGSETQSSSKVVTIDYDTVIPHVDFDYQVQSEDKISAQSSTTSAIVAHALDSIIHTTMMMVKDDTTNGKLAVEVTTLHLDENGSESLNMGYQSNEDIIPDLNEHEENGL